MAYVSDTDLLGKVRDAIEAIVVRGVESYEIDTGAGRRKFTFLDIETLRSMERELVVKIEAASKGRARVAVIRRTGS